MDGRSARRFVLRGVIASLAAVGSLAGILIVADGRRKRNLVQGRLSASRPEPIVIGDSVLQVYTDGEDLFTAMLYAIRAARIQILFETYIWKDDLVGRQFKHELELAAARGVEVYIIFDSFANLVVPRRFKRFPPSLHVLAYPIVPWPMHPLHVRSYARDHRKILVVDGETAFVGGYNIGAVYATEWRDTHLRVSGPHAWELENVFIDFWNVHRTRNLPALPSRHTRIWDPRIDVHRNDPRLLIFPIRTTYLEAIDRASRHVYLTHAYFVPDRIVLRGLLQAARRGVDVRLLMPARSNHVLSDWLARSRYDQCLSGGIRLLLYQDAMVHAKTATIDGAWSTIGTANLDRLSMVGNFEVNVEIYDSRLAARMEEIFADDAVNCRELTLVEWRRRPLRQKIAEAIVIPIRPFL
ncbi:MAG TPA: phospholipase D-like domain-containing protein [Chloroflexota bacterium]|nr:phospholipase D-like domain-containing protein [Chloroflexota bacterium]